MDMKSTPDGNYFKHFDFRFFDLDRSLRTPNTDAGGQVRQDMLNGITMNISEQAWPILRWGCLCLSAVVLHTA